MPAPAGTMASVTDDPSGRGRQRIRMTGKERRQQLLDIGRSLFAEKGFEATSIEEIASRAGVSKPVVYEHFGGKEGLYAVVVDREMQSLLNDIASEVEYILAREFDRRGLQSKLAGMYAQMLVGMVALTGQWWLEVRKPERDEVAAHLVNLGWNGLRGLESEPSLSIGPAGRAKP